MVRYTANGCPSEDDEEHLLSDYCDNRGWKHTHVSNETFTTSWNQKRKMRYLGVSSGFTDHIVIMKVKKMRRIVFIELKRQKGGSISDNQYEWVHELQEAGQKAVVCRGGQEAIDYLESIENGTRYQFTLEYRFQKQYKSWLKKQNQELEMPF